MLDEYRAGAFFHHLGHGFGLFPHEGPHLNPRWDDTFAVGDVFTAEPGLYGPELRAGIRLEENYVVTETGVERLTRFRWNFERFVFGCQPADCRPPLAWGIEESARAHNP